MKKYIFNSYDGKLYLIVINKKWLLHQWLHIGISHFDAVLIGIVPGSIPIQSLSRTIELGLRIQYKFIRNFVKHRPEKSPHLDTSNAVVSMD